MGNNTLSLNSVADLVFFYDLSVKLSCNSSSFEIYTMLLVNYKREALHTQYTYNTIIPYYIPV